MPDGTVDDPILVSETNPIGTRTEEEWRDLNFAPKLQQIRDLQAAGIRIPGAGWGGASAPWKPNRSGTGWLSNRDQFFDRWEKHRDTYHKMVESGSNIPTYYGYMFGGQSLPTARGQQTDTGMGQNQTFQEGGQVSEQEGSPMGDLASKALEILMSEGQEQKTAYDDTPLENVMAEGALMGGKMNMLLPLIQLLLEGERGRRAGREMGSRVFQSIPEPQSAGPDAPVSPDADSLLKMLMNK